MFKGFTFNGVSSASFGLIVNNITNYGSPARNVEKIEVPYRNGDLAIDLGTYTNYIVTYDVQLYENTPENIQAIAQWLLAPKGYQRLEDDWHTDEYRSAMYYNQIDWLVSSFTRFGRASISFDCKPQRWLKSGETSTTLTSNGTMTNPTQMSAKPLIVVTGNGNFTVNGYTVAVSNNASTITIDCETMQCYTGNTNMNNYVTLDEFPTLKAGSNTINKGNVTRLVITPRWWRL